MLPTCSRAAASAAASSGDNCGGAAGDGVGAIVTSDSTASDFAGKGVCLTVWQAAFLAQ
jgi:hypothetical protein